MRYVIAICGLCYLLTLFRAEAQELTHDQRVIAMTILGEARGEGYRGMYAVACVIQERMKQGNKTGAQVCLKRKHFSCWNASDPNRKKLPQLLNTPEGYWAKQMAIHIGKLNSEFIKGADHYHSGRAPWWTKKMKHVATVGRHRFYKSGK